MTMQQLLNAPPSSKIGVNVAPRFVVFHTPPKAVATYQVLVFFGSISMSATRPLTTPPVIPREVIDLSWSALRPCAVRVSGRRRAAPSASLVNVDDLMCAGGMNGEPIETYSW